MTIDRRDLAGVLSLLLLACSSAATTTGSPSDPGGGGQTGGTVDNTTTDGGADAGVADDGGTVPDGGGPGEAAGGDVYKQIFDHVDKANLQKLLEELTGGVAVTAGGATFNITERWSPPAKANFRKYWSKYMTDLGATVNDVPFAVKYLAGETQGHTVEAVLPGQSADTVVIIVHYDSVGITGREKENPAADDDGSGLAMQMEAARIFSSYRNRRYTVRFVAADYEEISDNLDGDVAYVAYLVKEAASKGFKILVAADDDQTGWSCWDENLCGKSPPGANSTFLMISCSGDSDNYDYPDLTKGITEVATAYSAMKISAVCDGSGDTDHYSFWQAGIPAYVIEEYGSDKNPHYDDTGDDTMAHINLDYLFHTSQIAITYQAKLAGIGP